MTRLDTQRQERLEPSRMKRAIDKLDALDLMYVNDDKVISVRYKGNTVMYWPYSGWHQGKGIKPGRGFDNFFNQLT